MEKPSGLRNLFTGKVFQKKVKLPAAANMGGHTVQKVKESKRKEETSASRMNLGRPPFSLGMGGKAKEPYGRRSTGETPYQPIPASMQTSKGIGGAELPYPNSTNLEQVKNEILRNFYDPIESSYGPSSGFKQPLAEMEKEIDKLLGKGEGKKAVNALVDKMAGEGLRSEKDVKQAIEKVRAELEDKGMKSKLSPAMQELIAKEEQDGKTFPEAAFIVFKNRHAALKKKYEGYEGKFGASYLNELTVDDFAKGDFSIGPKSGQSILDAFAMQAKLEEHFKNLAAFTDFKSRHDALKEKSAYYKATGAAYYFDQLTQDDFLKGHFTMDSTSKEYTMEDVFKRLAEAEKYFKTNPYA